MFKNKRILRKSLKLLRGSFRDPIFYLILCDYILTQYIIKGGFGVEANPLVNLIGNTPALLVSIGIYFLLLPKKGLSIVRIFLLGYFIWLNIHHLFILLGY